MFVCLCVCAVCVFVILCYLVTTYQLQQAL